MSLRGKIFLAVSAFSFLMMTLLRWIIGGWFGFLYVFLVLFFLGIVLAVYFDFRFYRGFLWMRTTKNGMTMGMSILLAVLLFSGLGYFSNLLDKSFDITEEKINTLSPQSVKILDALEENLYIRVFYKGKAFVDQRNHVKRNLQIFKRASGKVVDRYYNAYLEAGKSQEYLLNLPGAKNANVFTIVEYKGKRILVDPPYLEEQITTAIIRATRRGSKSVYFLTGHGERALDDTGEEGISHLKEDLENASIEARSWSFISDGELKGEEVSLLVLAGPKAPLLEAELVWVQKYIEEGGSALFTLDPDAGHGMGPFLKKQFGLTWSGHYILDAGPLRAIGYGPLSVLSRTYADHPMTQSLFSSKMFSLFFSSSPIDVDESAKAEYEVTNIVQTSDTAFTIPEIKERIEIKPETVRKSFNLGVLLTQKEEAGSDASAQEKDNEAQKEDGKNSSGSAIMVFGDSDFMSNKLFRFAGANKDLTLNAISYLVDEEDLVSIRPKTLAFTKLKLTAFDRDFLVIFASMLPILFFGLSFFFWLRKRKA